MFIKTLVNADFLEYWNVGRMVKNKGSSPD